MANQYRPQGFRVLPPVVKNLLIINGVFFLATITLQNAWGIDLVDYFGLHYFAAEKFSPFQFITYMFMHGGFSHILFNMFALWMFGNVLENVWGPKRFLTYYLITGIGAALVHYLVFYIEISPVITKLDYVIANPSLENLFVFNDFHKFQISNYSGEIWTQFLTFQNEVRALNANPSDHHAIQGIVSFLTNYKEYYLNAPVVIGASGAVFGILLAFGMLFPNSLIYIYFAFPIKAKYFVIIYGAIELFSGFYDTTSNVAHFAHLGGMIFGFFLILYWKKKG